MDWRDIEGRILGSVEESNGAFYLTYDFKRVGDDADGHQFFAVVAAVHHQGICEALDYGALGFSEALHGKTASGVRDVDWIADLNIITGMFK